MPMGSITMIKMPTSTPLMPPLTTLLPVVVGLFEIDQRECGNIQKTADDQRQQQRALDDIFHGCHKLSSL